MNTIVNEYLQHCSDVKQRKQLMQTKIYLYAFHVSDTWSYFIIYSLCVLRSLLPNDKPEYKTLMVIRVIMTFSQSQMYQFSCNTMNNTDVTREMCLEIKTNWKSENFGLKWYVILLNYSDTFRLP